MNNPYFNRPDGEYRMDIPTKPIPPAETWDKLSTNQLLEVQTALETKLWEFRNHEAIKNALTQSAQSLRILIAQKIAEGR